MFFKKKDQKKELESEPILSSVEKFKIKASSLVGVIGMSLMLPSKAFASGSIDITSVDSILGAIGGVCCVAGAAIVAWNVVQIGQTLKDSQGFQLDSKFWGALGGLFMIIGGYSFTQAGAFWTF